MLPKRTFDLPNKCRKNWWSVCIRRNSSSQSPTLSAFSTTKIDSQQDANNNDSSRFEDETGSGNECEFAAYNYHSEEDYPHGRFIEGVYHPPRRISEGIQHYAREVIGRMVGGKYVRTQTPYYFSNYSRADFKTTEEMEKALKNASLESVREFKENQFGWLLIDETTGTSDEPPCSVPKTLRTINNSACQNTPLPNFEAVKPRFHVRYSPTLRTYETTFSPMEYDYVKHSTLGTFKEGVYVPPESPGKLDNRKYEYIGKYNGDKYVRTPKFFDFPDCSYNVFRTHDALVEYFERERLQEMCKAQKKEKPSPNSPAVSKPTLDLVQWYFDQQTSRRSTRARKHF